MKKFSLIATLILDGGLMLLTVLTFIAFGLSALAMEVKTNDGLVMSLSGTGQVTGLSADGSELLSPGKVGGFLVGEYRLNPGLELVENGSFETPGGFQMGGGWHRDMTVAHTGQASLCVDVPKKGEFYVRVPLRPNATYMVTFYMKSEGLDGRPILHIRRLDAQGSYILGQANIEYLGIYYPDWVRLQHTFQTLPGTVSGELMFHVVYGKLRGKVWLDNLSIRELPLPQPVAIQAKVIPDRDGVQLHGEQDGDRHGGNVRWIKSANDAGMYAMTYNEPWMWRARLGRMVQPVLPPAEEIIAREQRDIDVWDKNDSHDYGQVPRAYSVRAFLNSVFHDEFGQPVMNGLRSYGAGSVVEWLTNADPEIVGPYGKPNRGMLSWTYEFGNDVKGAQKLGGTANGIRYDSLTEWVHLGAENFRREHFAFADIPLTFSYRVGRPCQLGYFCALEYMTFVRKKMLKQNGITYANGAISVPWFTWLLDGISREGWLPDMEGYQRIRMLMYQKTCGDWGGARWHLSDVEIERRLNTCLTYTWWPGIDGAPQRMFDQKRHIFKKYIPVLRALAQAGWEPVTYATAKPKGAIIERFGSEDSRPLFFTVRNTRQSSQTISVTIDAKALGLSANRLRVSDVLAGKEIASVKNDGIGVLYFSLRIPAQTTIVLGVNG